MNGEFYGRYLNTSESIEEDKEMSNPVTNLEPFTAEVHPVALLVRETPAEDAASPITPLSESIPYSFPVGEMLSRDPPSITNSGPLTSLFTYEEIEQLKRRWNEIQGKFVDEPRAAVHLADQLLTEVIEQITQKYIHERSTLKGQLNKGEEASTEELRNTLMAYRTFFNRLVV